jgi:hypothetical protein
VAPLEVPLQRASQATAPGLPSHDRGSPAGSPTGIQARDGDDAMVMPVHIGGAKMVGDEPSLTPWEQHVIARMEEEFGRHNPGMPGRVGQRPVECPGPLLFIGAAVATFGTVLAFGVPTGHTPLAIAGYILVLVGLMIVWGQL